ncbi:hypothetical protein ABZ297_32515 [Nonomuraea sp. NPDC005983]|uniref:hypothetical protein n=1 Tax=Nonomuraea sp. NPDC005983 TaxID=3155595 RepID=UPI0033AEC39D
MRRAGWLLACVLAAGCGPLSQTHHNPGNSHEVATAGASPAPGEAHTDIAVVAGRVSPPSGWLEAAKGQQVSITVTSDVPDELHVHGYDLEAELPAGRSVTIRFKAGLSGVFEVETHKSKLVLTQLAVR